VSFVTDRPGRLLVWAAFGWTLLVGALLLLVPLTETTVVSVSTGSAAVTRTERQTLAEEQGARVAFAFAVPVCLAGAAVVARRRAARPVSGVTGGVLLVLCGIAAASIGLLYLPAAGLLIAAAARTPSPAPAAPGPATPP
jgi:hypothetical protein